jgi:sodium-dependent dicarboxylate transporter 2/3/5
MDMLQNAIILTTGFLLSQILIASNTHYRLIAYLLRHTGSGVRALLTAVLLISYALTVFMSNTVVVLALIPVIRRLMVFLSDSSSKKEIATLFYLALTFGTTTGGLASLSGHPLNALALGIAELYKLEGRSGVNFFSWLMTGLPASLVLLAGARGVLLLAARKCSDTELVYPGKGDSAVFPHRPLLFFALNMLFITTMTGIQFFLKPEPVGYGLSAVDIVFLLYGLAFIFFTFLYPRKNGVDGIMGKNALFLLFFLAAFPLLSVCRISREIETHLRVPLKSFYAFLENRLQKGFNIVWNRFFRESPGNLDTPNFNTMLSINRIILEIPYFGLLLIMIFGTILYAAMQAGDNPSIPGNDGYLITALTSLVLEFIQPLSNPLLLLPSLNITAAFSSELLSNTAIVVILAPLMITMAQHTGLSALLLLLSLTVSASAAYMTPLASPANTLAFGGLDHVSLKTVMKAGLIMNIISAMLISALFIGISFFL